MAQGAIKLSAKPSAGGKPNPAKTKKGARVSKAKKPGGADKALKKYAAGITAKTEKLLGARAGHLEMIGGKGKKKDGNGKAEPAEKKKGGSRKFG